VNYFDFKMLHNFVVLKTCKHCITAKACRELKILKTHSTLSVEFTYLCVI